MINIYKLIKGITVKHKVGSNDRSKMVSQLSSSSPNGNDPLSLHHSMPAQKLTTS